MKNCKHTGDRTLCYLRPSKASKARGLSPIHPEYEEERVFQCNVCVDCGHWLSLGPARDTAETAIEARAAELANTAPDDGTEPSMMEWAGGRHYHEGHEMPTSTTALAGWLAAAIANHDSEQALADIVVAAERRLASMTEDDVKAALAEGRKQREAAAPILRAQRGHR